MKICLWDTRQNDAQKDFAGGMGVGMHPGTGGLRGQIVRRMYRRDYRPPSMNFAYLSAIFKKLGHQVTYTLDEIPAADLYVFNPSLVTAEIERDAIARIRFKNQSVKILVVGQVAFAMPDYWNGLDVTVVRGEAEQILTKLDDILNSENSVVNVGSVEDLDSLPIPDWSVFKFKDFRINYDFWRFPTTFIQQSRGCTFKCNYCPYIMIESKTRFRDPDAVVDEIRYGSKDMDLNHSSFAILCLA